MHPRTQNKDGGASEASSTWSLKLNMTLTCFQVENGFLPRESQSIHQSWLKKRPGPALGRMPRKVESQGLSTFLSKSARP